MPSEVAPGAEVKINLKSSPKAFVGLLAVDKSVLLQKTGNDIDRKRVIEDLLKYDPSESYEPLVVTGNDSNYEDFGGSNSFILTNALNQPPSGILDERFKDEEDSNEYHDDVFDKNWGKQTSVASKPTNIRIRKNFPETWIFESFFTDSRGQFMFHKHAPDTITSWVVTGFSFDHENGLAISDPQNLLVKQKMFIKLNLPYSIRWGEILKVEISVFNYVPDRKFNLSVDVEMFRDEDDPDFEFIDVQSKCVHKKSTDNSRQKLASVAQNSMKTVFFHIKPLKVGKITLNVKAIGQQMKLVDAVEKMLLVESEGITQYENCPVFIDLNKGVFDSFMYTFTPLEFSVPKSVKMGVSIIGDLMGNTLLDVTNLL